MLAVGEGASEEAQEQIRQLGSQNVILRSVKPPDDKVSNQTSRVIAYGLTEKDLRRIETTYPGVESVVPVLEVPDDVRAGARKATPRVRCVPPEFLDVTGRILFEGRFLSQTDQADANPTCVLGYEVARTLFPFQSAVGERVKIGSNYFDVVGVMMPRVRLESDPGVPGVEVGEEVFLPLRTGKKFYGGMQVKLRSGSREMEQVELHEIIVAVERADDVPVVAAACRQMLERYHDQKDYEVVVPLELLLRARETQRIFNVVLGSIAGISLLVGGIGIMNVMLATVTERTREIGIRRALGAKRRHIVTQFLVETIVLSAGGGIAGVALGMSIPLAVERFAELKTIVTPSAPLLAFGISVATGIVFGLYPRVARGDDGPGRGLAARVRGSRPARCAP